MTGLTGSASVTARSWWPWNVGSRWRCSTAARRTPSKQGDAHIRVLPSSPEIVLNASIDGARAGAPAIQVADRFYLLPNLAEALDQVFSTHGKALKAVSDALSRTPVVQPDGRTAVPVPPATPTPQAQMRAAQRRARRLATDEHG
jgi:hypothetical protein